MEKQIRNARKRVPPEDASKRRRLSSLSKSAVKRRASLRELPDGAKAAERRTEAQWPPEKVKTFEIINGAPVFYLVIPCATSDPDRKSPLYLVETNADGGPEKGVWQCQECTRIYYTRKAWMKHAGMVPNIMGSCPGG